MATVAFVITELERGGAELALLALARGLVGGRFRPVAVYSLDEEGPVGRSLRRTGIPVHALRARRHPVTAVLDLVRSLRALRPTILQTFLFHANVIGRWAGMAAGIRHIVSSARVTEPDKPWRAAVDRLTHGQACRITCVSSDVRDYLRRAAGIPDAKLVVIPNGVEPAPHRVFAPRTGPRTVLTVAHLREQKGIDVLVRAVPAVLRDFPDTIFRVAGAGDAGPYRALAGRLGVGASIRFEGEVESACTLLAESDLFVLSSRWEGCPNAVLEAMAWGVPVIATAVGGVPELIVDGESGRLVPAGSPEALSDAIRDLLRDYEWATRLGQAGRERAATQFTVPRMIAAYESLYTECLSGKRRPVNRS